MFGDYADFAARVENLEDDIAQAYTDKLYEEGVLIEFLDDEQEE